MIRKKRHTIFCVGGLNMFIIKRDGTQVPFDYKKIVNAINRAFIEVDGQLYENDTAFDIALDIGRLVEQSPIRITVEDI